MLACIPGGLVNTKKVIKKQKNMLRINGNGKSKEERLK